MKDFLYDSWPGLLIGLLCLALVAGICIAVGLSCEHYDRMMAQCMADGRKEYECEAMLSSKVAPAPVVMPVVIGR